MIDVGNKALASLTAREKAVAVAMTQTPDSRHAIAKQLRISPETLRVHIFSIYNKLGTGNRLELFRYMWQNNVIQVQCPCKLCKAIKFS